MTAVRGHLALLAALLVAAAARADAPEPLGAPWRSVGPGVDVASAAELGGDPTWAARVILVDPARARFAVRFDATKPTIDEWRARYPAALAISNGSFFSADEGRVRPTCDLIADGKPVKGAGCHREDALYFGAVARRRPPPTEAAPAIAVAVAPPAGKAQRGRAAQARAPDAGRHKAHDIAERDEQPRPEVPRLLSAADFRASDWHEAIKSFPTLVHGGYPACVGFNYCAESSRTAAVAQLRDGRLLLFASQWPAVRKDVARFLAETLGAEEAVNLDGGPEATLVLKDEAPDDAVGNRKVGLPTVLVVLPIE